MTMCSSTAQACTKCLAGAAFLLRYVCFSWQAWQFRDILKSGASCCETGARHKTLVHPCGRRSTLGTLLKRWHAWVKRRGGFRNHFYRGKNNIWWTRTVLRNGRTSCLWNCRHCWFGTWWWFPVASAALGVPRAHVSWQGHFVDLNEKMPKTYVKHCFTAGEFDLGTIQHVCVRATRPWLCACRITLVVA